VDAVLAATVLCSVRDQDAALAEIRRVLRPGGRFVFFEHVAAPRGTWTRLLQRATAPFSRVFDHGCDPSRETWRSLERARFRDLRLGWFARGGWPFVAGVGVA
jgi:ubiquinone/menaquinone biosynthesis C-methylase UbiE